MPRKYRIVETRDCLFAAQERQWYGLWRTIDKRRDLDGAKYTIKKRIEQLEKKSKIIHYFG